MWEYLVKKIRPSNAPRSPKPTAAPRGPTDSQALQPTEKHPPAEAVGGRPRRLLCPACSGAMRVEIIGRVEIDRCTACGGIFLDRGELEVLTHDEYSGGDSSPSAGSKADVAASENTRYSKGSVLIYTPTGLR